MPLDVICFALKLVGALCIMGGCCGMGYFMCTGLSGRLRALTELKSLVLHMSGEIRCMSEPVPAMLAHTAQMAGPVYRDFFYHVSSDLRQGKGQKLSSGWAQNVDIHLSGGPLKASDLKMIQRLGDTLGSHDTKMQLSFLEFFGIELQTTIDKLGGELSSQKKVYGGLWVLGGVFVVILFI